MSTIKPIKFSEQFGIDSAKLAELGVFDPILNYDTKLFVEPLLLKDSKTPIMQSAFATYKTFFANLMLLLKKSKQTGDRCWRAVKGMVYFPEYKYTCIGYGTGTIDGAGSGSILNEQILESAREIILEAKDDPSIFLLLPLLEEGIGPDIISDMTQNIIDDNICEYTAEITSRLGIKGTRKYHSKENKLYELPYNPYHKCVIKLIPLDILTNAAAAENFDNWLVDSAHQNQALRSKVNELIGVTWFDATKAEKKEALLDLIKKDKPFFVAVLKALQDETFIPYDLEKDSEGLYRWLEDSKIIAKIVNFDRKNLDYNIPLTKTVGFIIEDFKNLIEQHELWRLFWTQINKRPKHVKEFYSKMLFFMVSSAWTSGQDNKIAIDRVYDKESKQLETIFTIPGQQKVKVQLKHSDNSSGLRKTYENQVTHCIRKNIHCYYIVLDFLDTKSNQLDYILKNEDPLCKIIQIDVTFKQDEDFGDLTVEYFDVEDSDYIKEKRKGGASSYKGYNAIRETVKELCILELAKRHYQSALQLCSVVSGIVEKNHQDLLS